MKKANTTLLSFAMVMVIVFCAGCGDDEATQSFEFPANSVSITKVYDIDNNGNSKDIRIDFKLSTTSVLQQAQEIRLIVSKNVLTIDQVKSLAADRYQVVTNATGLTTVGRFASAIKDAEGNAIVNDVSYSVYVVLKNSEAYSLSNSMEITLMEKPIYAGRYKGLWSDALFQNFAVSMILNDDYTGVIFYSSNFTTCCPAGGMSDATVKFIIDGTTISSFEANQFLGNYNGGHCPATYTAEGTVTDEITLSLSNLTGTDCDGNHTPGTIVFTKQ